MSEYHTVVVLPDLSVFCRTCDRRLDDRADRVVEWDVEDLVVLHDLHDAEVAQERRRAEEEERKAAEQAALRKAQEWVAAGNPCTRNVLSYASGSVCDVCGHNTMLHPGAGRVRACTQCEMEIEVKRLRVAR